MNENISRLMDGELDPGELDNVCAGLRRPDAMATWTCYHVIGETLRGTPTLAASPAQRFAVRLAAEPTVLAPRPRPVSNAATWAFAAAATVAAITVVGWTAMSVLGDPPTTLKPPIVQGWVLRRVYDGAALIEGRDGIIEVEPGIVAPGLGRIEGIKRQDGRWVVVTSRGLVVGR